MKEKTNIPEFITNNLDEGLKQVLDFLWKDLQLNCEQWRAIWQSFCVAFPLSLTAIWASFLFAFQYENAKPIFVILPFLITGWTAILYLIMAELTCRDRYSSILERKISKLSNTNFPCWETDFRPIIYGRTQLILGVVASIPIVFLYIFSVYKAYQYLVISFEVFWVYGYITLCIAIPILLQYFFFLVAGKNIELKIKEFSEKLDVLVKDI